MARPAQLTAAAVLALFGSLVTFLLGVAAFAGSPEHRVISALWIVAGTWGAITSVGVLRLQKWARMSMLIFSAITAYLSALFAPLLAYAHLSPPLDDALLPRHGRLALLGVGVLSAALGTWWLFLFGGNRAKGAFGARPNLTPFGISVIGWLLIAGGMLDLLVLLRIRNPFPTMHFGFVLRGGGALAAELSYAAAGLYFGISLLRRTARSPLLAAYFLVIRLLDGLVFLIRPDRDANVQVFSKALTDSNPGVVQALSANSRLHYLELNSTAWGVIMLIAIWFLIVRKDTFKVEEESLPAGHRLSV